MTVHFSEKTRAPSDAIMIVNDGTSSLSDVKGAMPNLYDTGAIASFNADPEEEKGGPVREFARWPYEMLNARVADERSKPNG